MDERHLSSVDIKNLTANSSPDKAPIAILPVGCTEQHGPFLPLETDTLIACGMASSLATRMRDKGFPVHVLPPIAYSPTRSNASFPGTVSVGEQAFRDYVASLVNSLIASEFETVVLLSGHGPADASLREIAFVAVDEQFRGATKNLKPMIPVSLAEASSQLQTHFKDRPGRHADWREFLMVYHLLGQTYFTKERMQGLKTFQKEHAFDVTTGHVPGVPLEYRSTQGVIGRPLPESITDYDEMAERAWRVILERVFTDLCSALSAFSGIERRGPHAG